MTDDRWRNVGAREEKRRGRLTFETGWVDDVGAEIVLPERDSGEIKAVFRWPSKSLGLGPETVGFADFSGELTRADGSAFEVLRLSGLHLNRSISEQISPSVQVIRAEGEASSFSIFRIPAATKARDKVTVSAVLSPNVMLAPWSMDRVSSSGAIVPDSKARKVKVKVAGLGSVTFEHRYEWGDSPDHRVRYSCRYLCAEWKVGAKLIRDEASLRAAMLPLDDLMLWVGFASRTPTRCVGCMVSGREFWAEWFRRDVRVCTGRQRYRTRGNSGLVGLEDLGQFLTRAMAALAGSHFKPELRHALYALENRLDSNIEQGFVDLFSAFEALLDAISGEECKKRFQAEAAHRKAARDRLLKTLEEWVGAKEISAELRNQFAKQIRNVQSVSFAEKYRTLLRLLPAFSYDDLWPMIASGDTISLYLVRNRLSHGAVVTEDQIDAVWTASRQLEWLLERLIVAILGWPLEDTDLAAAAIGSTWSNRFVDWAVASKLLGSGRD